MAGEPSTEARYLCVEVDGHLYGLDTRAVREVGHSAGVTEVPGAPDFVEGVINHRGRIISLIDTGRRLGVTRVGEGPRSHVVVVSGDQGVSALLVDAILDIRGFERGQVEPPPAVAEARDDGLFEGVARLGDRIVGLLDARELVAFELASSLLTEDADLAGPATVPASEAAEPEDGELHAVVRIGGEEYAFRGSEVLEARPCGELDRTGDLPDYVAGLTTHGSRLVPVVDLHRRLHAGVAGGGGDCLVVVGSEEEPTGVLVDEVVELLRLREAEVSAAPDVVQGGDDQIRGLGVKSAEERVLVLLDAARLVRAEDAAALRSMGREVLESDQREETVEVGEEREFVMVRVEGTAFAVEGTRVREILGGRGVTWVPFAPPYVRGVFHLRGEVLPLVDLRARLGLPAGGGDTEAGKVLVVEHGGQHYGLHVDHLESIGRVASSRVQDPPGIVHGVDTRFLCGVYEAGDETVLVLDPDRLFLRAAGSGGGGSHGDSGGEPG